MALVPQGNLAASKPSLRRQNIELKRALEENKKRFATFSKRKQGIIDKACELSVLCKAPSAVIVFSPNDDDEFYTFGNPDPDSVIHRYLSAGVARSSLSNSVHYHAMKEISLTSQQHEITRQQLEDKKKRLATIMAREAIATEGSNGRFWWDQSIEEMSLEDLEGFADSLQKLKQNVFAKVHHHMMTVEPPASSPSFSYLFLMNGILSSEDEACGWDHGM